MGYPMTFTRFLKRNSLSVGGYENPGEHAIGVNTNHLSPVDGRDFMAELWPHVVSQLQRYERAFKMILGDLRRLEHDAVDERGICTYIATRTGVDANIVAAVLKEFMSW